MGCVKRVFSSSDGSDGILTLHSTLIDGLLLSRTDVPAAAAAVPVFAWLFDLQLSIYQCHNRTSEDAERA